MIARESLVKVESYELYFDSFISFYSDRFDPEWLENKKREMELRIGKARARTLPSIKKEGTSTSI